jgi:protocatechuate 3,4-dioxygenase beta subunit
MLLAFAAGQANENQGVVRGKVTRAGTSEPISDVEILLVGPLTGPAANAAVSNPLMLLEIAEGSGTPKVGSITSSDGSFVFRNLPPGQYTIRGQREGYFSTTAIVGSSGLRSVVTASLNVSGSNTADVNLKMVKSATVGGRVLNSEGKPVSNLPVAAYQVSYGNGIEGLESAGFGTTDDRGQYRLYSLFPGDYYIGVGAGSRQGVSFPLSAAVTGYEQCCTLFFPGVRNAHMATLLSVAEGAELLNRDIDLRALQTFKVSGHLVTVPPGLDAPRATSNFNLVSRDTEALTSPLMTTYPSSFKPDGSFEIQNVPPGSYDLAATMTDGNAHVFNGRIPIEVGTRDLEDVRLPIHPSAEVRIRILLDGNLQPPRPRAGAQLMSTEIGTTFLDAVGPNGPVVDSSGAFVVSNVPEGRYSVRVGAVPANSYISDIRQGGISIYDSGLVVGSSAPEPVEVMLSSGALSIRGKTLGSDGKPVASATVVLIPPPARRQNAQMYRTIRADRNGEFSMNNVAPGEYKVFAWESVPNTAYMNASFMEKYESRGRTITISQGSNLNFDVTVIPAEQAR